MTFHTDDEELQVNVPAGKTVQMLVHLKLQLYVCVFTALTTSETNVN